MKTSVIICTCNRAAHLRPTLESLSNVRVPHGVTAELIVVDNASTDSTVEVIKACRLPHMTVRYIHEAKRGQCHARNTGMAQSQGDILLWTDDDVRPPANWIEKMTEPIVADKAQAVAGAVKMAPHLQRPWMSVLHRSLLASTERLDAESPEDMVGANMAFARQVLQKVPAFDTELGPGALGFGDDTLFSWQLRKAGCHIAMAPEAVVEHHFDESRLSRKSFLDIAAKLGRSEGYIGYHWHHYHDPHAWRHLVKARLRLLHSYAKKGRKSFGAEGCPEWELELHRNIAVHRQYLVERNRPRNYKKHGLVKRRFKVKS